MDDNIRKLIFEAIDQTISANDFERLQDEIEADESVRDEYLRAVRLADSLTDLADNTKIEALRDRCEQPPVQRFSMRQFAVLASLLVVVSSIGFWLGQRNVGTNDDRFAKIEKQAKETTISGHATLSRSVDLKWSDTLSAYREGDVLPHGIISLKSGLAEIDFFCGATLIVEGPAQLDIESDWSVTVLSGRLRANVPPAAQGFVVKAADSEIIDLGTEFALEVDNNNAHVEVIDGEVKLRGGEHDGSHLVTGQKQWLSGDGRPDPMAGFTTLNDLETRRTQAEKQRFTDWQNSLLNFKSDTRLLAHFPIAQHQVERIVHNTASSKSSFDGNLIGPVGITAGRFGTQSTGLEFDRAGSRVRTRIDGEFEALTFSCWVRIDSLDHVYNALFMADGYENGEPHWQIKDDGRLMFSVMVDDSTSVRTFSEVEQRYVDTAGVARIYYTEPFWDVSKSGQWFHLAAVYDPSNRIVEQYVNGERISSQEIIDKYYIETLRIGPSEIGNWGQPFRETPWFSVRNLNGTIDELAIFDAALASEEILKLYQIGKPLGY